jgi:alkylhydroperoxidase family enzyme
MGGVGKTQLAAAHARRLWDERVVDLVVWVTASSRAALVSAYAQAAVDVTGVDDENPERGATRFLAWMSEPHGRRWLVVLDDVQHPNDITGLWPPTSRTGRTVVTTRRRDAALLCGRQVVDVGLFTPDQSLAYLRTKLGEDSRLLAGADSLAQELGHLPLALAQAATYLQDRGLDCTSYRRRLSDRCRSLASLAPDALPDEQRATVAATWSLSIEAADACTPIGLARPVLEFSAMLDPNAIPEDAFTSPAAHKYFKHRLGITVEEVSSEDVLDALYSLHRLILQSLFHGE